MNSSLSDLISYCSWAKKNSRYRVSIGDPFFGLTLYYREYFAFSYAIRDALINFKILIFTYSFLIFLAKKCVKTFEYNLFSFFVESELKYNCPFKK